MSHQAVSTQGVKMELQLSSMEEIRAYCKVLAATDLVPKAYQGKPDNIFVAATMGKEVGLPFFQSLQSIAVVNGTPTVFGDAALAMVRASGLLESIDEYLEVDGVRQTGSFPILKWADEGRTITAVCRTKRVGESKEQTTCYSVDDAKRAGLWDKKSATGFPSPWVTTPQRMLLFRARGWRLRDSFSDVLRGLRFYEEVQDIEPQATVVTPTAPEPTKPSSLGALLKTQATTIEATSITVPSTPVAEPISLTPTTGTLILATPPGTMQVETPAPADTPTAATPEPTITVEDEAMARDVIELLGMTAKGRALLAGARKLVKLGPTQMTPPDCQRFKIFLEELLVAKTKL